VTGLRFLIEPDAGLTLPQCFRIDEEALSGNGSRSRPDIVLMDLGLPGMKRSREANPAALKQGQKPGTATGWRSQSYEDGRPGSSNALCAGVSGYLLKKKRQPARQLECLQDVNDARSIELQLGRRAMSHRGARAGVIAHVPRHPSHQHTPLTTSRRTKFRLPRLLAEGHSYKDRRGRTGQASRS
jgi:DNA-binding NarL/FixJ family response regulator